MSNLLHRAITLYYQIAVLYDFSSNIPRYVPVVGAICAGVGLSFISRQAALSRRLARAQFINVLSEDCVRYQDAYLKSQFGNIAQKKEYRGDMSNFPLLVYLNFFEKLKLLLDSGVIDMETVDRMFAYRFFSVMHNRHVQKVALYSSEYNEYYSALFALHKQWSRYRRLLERSIPLSDDSLEKYNPNGSLEKPDLKHSLEKRDNKPNNKQYDESVERFKVPSWENCFLYDSSSEYQSPQPLLTPFFHLRSPHR